MKFNAVKSVSLILHQNSGNIMVKNEELLYNIVVTFPTLCAREFLILKGKIKN
jgi:hypothetical protein